MTLRAWLLIGSIALAASGCAGYKLGPVNGVAAGARSVQINPFENKTIQPRLGEEVTKELRREMQRDGTYSLTSHGDGDIVVSGTVNRYVRIEVTFSSGDVLTARDYRLELQALVTARDRSSGKLILNQLVSGTTLIRVENDLTSSERQAMPLLADDLAKNVTALLTEGSW